MFNIVRHTEHPTPCSTHSTRIAWRWCRRSNKCSDVCRKENDAVVLPPRSRTLQSSLEMRQIMVEDGSSSSSRDWRSSEQCCGSGILPPYHCQCRKCAHVNTTKTQGVRNWVRNVCEFFFVVCTLVQTVRPAARMLTQDDARFFQKTNDE